MDNTINKKIKTKKITKIKPFEYTYSPSGQITSNSSVILGYIMRIAVITFTVAGLLIFISDAFLLDVSVNVLFLISMLSSSVFAVMFSSLTAGLIILGLIAAGTLIFTFVIENSLDYIIFGFRAFWNAVMLRLENTGYQTFGKFDMTEHQLALSDTQFLIIAMAVTGAVISLIFTACIIKKVRIFPVLFIGILVCSTIFTYNINNTNFGFAIVLASLCAIIVLKLYDSAYVNKNDKSTFKTIALGGYAGFITLLLTLIIVMIPASNVNKRWIEIEFINDKLEYARALVSSVIIGDSPNLSDLGFVGNMDTLNARSTRAEDRSFTGKTMMTVQAAFNTPIYMRSWVGSYYSNDSWYSASTQDVERYHETFGTDFTPERLMYNFYNLINPRLTTFNSISSYGNHIEDGFITTAVDVSNVKSSGNLLYIPTSLNVESDLIEYGSREKVPYQSDWTRYYEGIVTTSWFNFNKTYRAIAFVPLYRNPDFVEQMQKNLLYYNTAMYYISNYGNSNLSSADQQSLIQEFETDMEIFGIKYTAPTAVERFFGMDNVERQNFMYENITLNYLYTNFVKSNYLSVPEDDLQDVLIPIVSEIFSSENYFFGDPQDNTHDTVLKVVDYLSENYEYSLSPAQPADPDTKDSALKIFLNETHQGYCVQFATAAAMLLRTAGIPTRYVEGYVASGFRRNEDTERAGNYITDVHDYDAHAWIEVYVEGMGWMQYETTPTYYIEMYAPYEPLRTSQSSGTPSEQISSEPEIEKYELAEVEGTNDYSRIIRLIIIAAVILLTVATFVLLVVGWIRKSNKIVQKRHDVITRSKKSVLDKTAVHELAKDMNDYILQIYAVEGCVPEKGELPSTYARRVSIAMEDKEFKEVMRYIEKEEFGYGVSRDELKNMADYMLQLWDKIYYNLNPFKRFWFRYIKKVI